MNQSDILKNKYTIPILKYIYAQKESGLTFVLPFIILLIVIIFVIYYIIKINLSIANLEWDKNKCVPKYMFVSGFMDNNKDKGILEYTRRNFDKCIKKLINE